MARRNPTRKVEEIVTEEVVEEIAEAVEEVVEETPVVEDKKTIRISPTLTITHN